MERHILQETAFRIDLGALMRRLRIREQSPEAEDLLELVAEAEEIARPRALYGAATVEIEGDSRVLLDGVEFTSRVLRVNLSSVHRAFPFVATCGVELDTWSETLNDRMLYRFWADEIKELALRSALTLVGEHLARHYYAGKVSHMNPGSLADWPIRQQRPLFALLGDPEAAIGVRLTDSLVMVPTKSVSGIVFASEVGFESCQLCQMEHCPNRRAPYDPELRAQKYQGGLSAWEEPEHDGEAG
jgi:hypothetical protein